MEALKRILLVEDDPALLNLTRTILEKLGYQVLHPRHLTCAVLPEAGKCTKRFAEVIPPFGGS